MFREAKIVNGAEYAARIDKDTLHYRVRWPGSPAQQHYPDEATRIKVYVLYPDGANSFGGIPRPIRRQLRLPKGCREVRFIRSSLGSYHRN